MKCSVCGITIAQEPLYRNNEKGVKAEWRCKKHLSPCSEPDKEVEDISNILHNGANKG